MNDRGSNDTIRVFVGRKHNAIPYGVTVKKVAFDNKIRRAIIEYNNKQYKILATQLRHIDNPNLHQLPNGSYMLEGHIKIGKHKRKKKTIDIVIVIKVAGAIKKAIPQINPKIAMDVAINHVRDGTYQRFIQ